MPFVVSEIGMGHWDLWPSFGKTSSGFFCLWTACLALCDSYF